MTAVKPGRKAEFSAFVNSSSRYLTRTAFLLTGNQELARDLVQEALTRTYAAWWRVRPDEALGYARRVLVNLNIDRLRRHRPELLEWADADFAVPDDAQRRVDDRDEVARMLSALAPQQRAVIVLRYFDDLPAEAVAACLGITTGSVKSACSRGLAHLRDHAAAPALEDEKR